MEMNRQIFKDNLIKTIDELKEHFNLNYETYSFIINPIVESGKTLNSKDDYMRLTILDERNIRNRILELDEVVNAFTLLEPLTPLWINVEFSRIEGDIIIFILNSSRRFRKPSLIRNQETGHAPFKAII